MLFGRVVWLWIQKTRNATGMTTRTDMSLDQLQLVPSGGDSGPRGPHTERTFFCHDIRVQLRELKCMELVS
jgi:hypothetical protein